VNHVCAEVRRHAGAHRCSCGAEIACVDTQALWLDVVDTMYDRLGLDGMDDVLLDWLIEHIEEPVRALICEVQGHTVIDDQCGRPDHRYCVVCLRKTPHEALTDVVGQH
jgi:LmbE family N-acetylglucosaminyl deacetylase